MYQNRGGYALSTSYQPVEHVLTSPRNGECLARETLVSQAPLDGVGQLIDHFRISTSRSLAVLRRGGLGDVLMLQGALRQIRTEYPHLDITLYTDEAYVGVMGDLEGIHVLGADSLPGNEYRYDALVDLSYYVERSPLKNHLDRASLFAMAFGMNLKDGRPYVKLTATERDWAHHLLQPGYSPTVALAPFATDPRRTWGADEAADLSRRIIAAGCRVSLITQGRGPQVEYVQRACPEVEVRDGYSTRQVAAILADSTAVVSVDTGIYHLAAAARTGHSPFIVLVWGLWDHRLRTKWMSNFAVVKSEAPCFPCNEATGSHITCTRDCMKIPAANVWERALAPALGVR